ncbi:MAG TPA: hypothetical protein VME20_06020 [Acidimicrobiales bacterium]|nr:hypothetical protein [Acidimicrobiales bacterium]
MSYGTGRRARAGLDVHKDLVVACVRYPGTAGVRKTEIASFSAFPADLLALRDWLLGYGVTRVAMEATGVYWKAVECWLLNARDLREFTRYRRTLAEERTREAQRLDKVLQDAGVKLSSAASDVLGASSRAMLAALVQGGRVPAALADLAKGKLRAKLPTLPAGKQKHGTARHGDSWLQRHLAVAAMAAVSSKDTYLRSQYRRLSPRRGKLRARKAVGHSILDDGTTTVVLPAA